MIAQLASIGVKPSDIHLIGISHTHPDHIGNVEEFPDSVVYIQRAEYEVMPFTPEFGQSRLYRRRRRNLRLRFVRITRSACWKGDADVFGDGSCHADLHARSHTPGHQSCMVHLPKTGWVITLSGDAVHLRINWDERRIPHFVGMPTIQKLETLTSMQRLADLLTLHSGQIWINHDKGDTEKTKHAPEFYE